MPFNNCQDNILNFPETEVRLKDLTFPESYLILFVDIYNIGKLSISKILLR